jgi:hypothetical protein
MNETRNREEEEEEESYCGEVSGQCLDEARGYRGGLVANF